MNLSVSGKGPDSEDFDNAEDPCNRTNPGDKSPMLTALECKGMAQR